VPPSARRLLPLALALLFTLGAAPSVETQLAPSIEDLDDALLEAERRLARSRAVGTAVGLIQNRFGELRDGERRLPVCEDDELASLVTRSRSFGPAWRDAAQSARVAADRVSIMATRETVASQLDDPRRERLAAVEAGAWQQALAAAEAGAWHRRYVESSFESCGLTLVPVPGLEVPGVRTPDELAAPIAVIGLHFGMLCPDQQQANGKVVLLAGPDACWSVAGCDCAPIPVHPGAVLGPADGLPSVAPGRER
jgi:hypothetical protein